ncbi:ABC transporter related protein [Planctopirus limnophila DSM 3776]|uniref:ABC transporter related protein n=1 Tax=Planctopirus limnophila (strain ATCC 43296 / DSM 3776 / IFAM 1008 / Mu 290) TaxID=521674 RepID=D5SUW0_PLAL2|nr:ABC transporter ATP-binding protein [Planctopirus limnophila]ADG69246.1 ABC transporter related protein [Planctopirus limnophila DSM 3776]
MTNLSTPSGHPALVVQDLSREFSNGSETLHILQGVGFTANTGEAIAITGPSGCGKSTLLQILGVLDHPTSGTVSLDGEDPFAMDVTQQAQFRNEKIGFIFQDHHLLPQLTVLENVLLPALPHRGISNEVRERALMLLDQVGLTARMDHKPTQLSGGERQRTAVCRALINRPRLLLADEPTGNLDPATAETVGKLLVALALESHSILLCVTHSEAMAQSYPRRCYLKAGQLVENQ